MTPKISVIIPVYNVEKYINECLDSVINQSLTEIEIILIDDGSKDKSGQILDQYKIADSRIKVIHKKNAGVSMARNDGLKICSGDFIYIMDSDDYLELCALQVMYESAIKTGADVIITDHYVFADKNSQKPTKLFSEEFNIQDNETIIDLQKMVLNPYCQPFPIKAEKGLGIAAPWSKLIRASLVKDHNIQFDPYVNGIFDDGLFALNIFENSKSVSYVNKCLYHYRILSTSLIHRFDVNRLEIDNRVFDRIHDFITRNKKEKSLNNSYYARILLYLIKSLRTYFLHPDNKGNTISHYMEFKKTIKKDPYCDAVNYINMKSIDFKLGMSIWFLRFHMPWVVWIRYYINNKIKMIR